MNFYDVLAAEKWGGGIPTTNFFDLLFAQSMGGGEQWQTYEGTLPATFNANGDDMKQYQIYGNVGGVGDDSGTAYGYEVDMAIGSNILPSYEIEQGAYYAAAGMIPEKRASSIRCRSKNFYTFQGDKIFYNAKSISLNVAFVDSDGVSLGGSGFKTGAGSVDVPANAAKCFFIIANTDTSANITPAQVIAAGIWASVDATITPIYIGDTALQKDEYIDYQAEKVYRKSANVFDKTATDTTNGYIANRYVQSDGSIIISNNYNVSEYITVEPLKEYNLENVAGNLPAICEYDENFEYISGENYRTRNKVIIKTSANAKYIRFSIYKENLNIIEMFTLTPTDPPVALPVLPTCEGTTIVDYAGSGTAPEKVYFEYQGGKQP